jgi:serine protease Do
MLESFNQSDVPLFGVIGSDRLAKLIASPPKKGQADRSWLGISLQALTKDLGEFLHIPASGGIIVNDVVKGSPADKAKLRIGDVIYKMNGQAVDIDMDEKVAIFQRRIGEMPAGTEVAFGVMRPIDSMKVDTMTVAATLETAPMSATNAPSYEDKMLELKVRNLVFSDFMAHNLEPGSLKGVVVSDMKEGGLADVGDLQFGDIIQRIGSTDVSSAEEAKQALEKEEKKRPKEIVFFVWRDNKTMFVNIKTQ